MHRILRLLALTGIFVPLMLFCSQDSKKDSAVIEEPAAKVELVSKDAEEAGNATEVSVSHVQRDRSVSGGIVREAIDLSEGTIRYFSVDTSTAMESTSPLLIGGDVEIVDYGPQGELPMENRRPNIYVMFNRPMVPLAALGKPIAESDILTIDPPVPGVYRWYGTKTLGFRPDKPLIDEPRYRITVSSKAESLSKVNLAKDLVFDIFGERVKIINIFPGNDADIMLGLEDIPPHLASQITVEFNQPVDLESIAKHIKVADRRQTYDFTLERPDYPKRLKSRRDRGALIILDKPPEEDSRVRITLEAGAVPIEGYPASSKDQYYQIQTLRRFHAKELRTSSYGFPQDNRPSLYPLYLRFSHRLLEDQDLPPFEIIINGEKTKAEDQRISWSSVILYLSDIQPGQRVNVKVPSGIKDVYNREAPPVTMRAKIPRPEPMVNFPSPSYNNFRHLEAEFEPAVVWTSRNVVQGFFGMLGKKNYFDQPKFKPEMSEYDVSGIPDTTVFHRDDLTPHLNAQGRGTVFMQYRMRLNPEQVGEKRQWRENTVAIQVTDLGLSVRVAYNRVLVWVNRLSNGEPVANAKVTVFNLNGSSYTGITNEAGLAVVSIPKGEFLSHFYRRERSSERETDRVHVRAEKAGDLAEIQVEGTHGSYSFGVYNHDDPDEAPVVKNRVHMFTDRGLYKPGEELALRGIHWLQKPEGFESYKNSYSIKIVSDSTDQVIWTKSGETTDSGGFAHKLTLPENLDPGGYRINYTANKARQSIGFRIAAFRRLSFQVQSNIAQDEFYHGDTIEASVEASYLAGGGMPGAAYHYYWTRKPVRFRPPGTQWENWTFGTSAWGSEQTLSSNDGTLSGNGSTRIKVGTIDHEVTGKAYRYTLETTVEDIDRQLVSSVTSAIVHPAQYYIGARFDSGSVDGWWSKFIPAGNEVSVRSQLVDAQGRPAAPTGSLLVGLMKGKWKSASQQGIYGVNTRWEYIEEETWRKEKALKNGEVVLDFTVDDPGQYTLFFDYVDQEGRSARTEIDFYVTGSGWVRRASQTPSDINLIVDKPLYEAGETARILVQSPIAKGRYLLSVEREGILEERIIELAGSNEIIEVFVKEEYLPVFYVALTSFTERTSSEDDYFEPDLGRPRGLFGLTTVRVSTTPVELDVQVETVSNNYGPGDDAEIVVSVQRNGVPVAGAEVTVLAVDRGVLDLINYHVPNPLEYFYDEDFFPHSVIGDDSRRLLLRPVTYEIANLQGGGSAKIEERKDFNPLALFEPYLRTGPDGTLRLTAPLPDNLSTYRLTALALDGARLGFDENEFQVSNPINVRTALPRQFRTRDTAAAGIVLSNTSDENQTVTVTAESDILLVAGEQEKKLTLPPTSVTELPFLLEAYEEGQGEIHFTIRSAILNEVLIEPVTVERPFITETFATIGIVNEETPAEESLIIPSYTAEGFGGLAIVVDSTLKPYIQQAVTSLATMSYPTRNDHLYKLVADLASGGKAANAKAIYSDLRKLQFPSGGIGYRSPYIVFSSPSWFLSALTAHVAMELGASEVQFTNAVKMDSLYAFLKTQLGTAKVHDNASFLAAWTAWILAEQGIVQSTDLTWLRDAEDELGIAGYNLLSLAYSALGQKREAKKLYQRSLNFVTIGTRSIDLAETYEKAYYFHTGTSEMALLLRTGIALGAEPEFLLRVAGALHTDRNSRRFSSHFDDFWVVSGFLPLLRRESRTSDTKVTIALNNQTILEGLGDGEEQSRGDFPWKEPPLSDMDRGTALPLNISAEGSGNLYYAASITYAFPAETTLPRDEGIEIFSQFESLDGEIHDVDKLPLGETLRLKVSVSTLNRRSFLKLVVPVPSGMEIVDPSFATTGSYGDAGGTGGEKWTRETVYGDTATFTEEGYARFGPDAWNFWFYRPIQTVFDNAVVYEWEDFYPGQREITFLVRTTTPGVYPTPPVTAALEFEPEVFGRGSSHLAIIKGE